MNRIGSTELVPFALAWNLRFLYEDSSQLYPRRFCLTGVRHGEYPIDAWKTYFLEVPSGGGKRDVIGRGHHYLGVGMKNVAWNQMRMVPFPVYANGHDADIETLKLVIRHWMDICIPDDIPCISIAMKCQGIYSENIQAQTVTVLMIWSDGAARFVTLDWSEGPWEDCPTPEWHIEATPHMGLAKVEERLRGVFGNLDWHGATYSILVIPSSLGGELTGQMSETDQGMWGREWSYAAHRSFERDLNRIISLVRSIFDTLVPDRTGAEAGRPAMPSGTVAAPSVERSVASEEGP
jgi:hypothetical protein